MTQSKAHRLARKQEREAKVAALRKCIEDGWPLREIYRTFHTSARFVKKWFPEYTGMPAQESGSLSMAIQQRQGRGREP